MDKLYRTMLYVPGNNAGMLQDADIYPADCILFDLEDSVAVSEKDSARFLVYEALTSLDYSSKDYFVRINSLESGLGIIDLEAMIPTGKVGIRLPKTENVQDILNCEKEIQRIEKACGREIGSTKMMAAVESAQGVLNAKEIAEGSKRLVAIAIGAEDYVTDLKTTRSVTGEELMFGRSMVLLAARNAGIAAIDTVYSNIDDEAGFRAEIQLVKKLGFDGKSVINPRQIGIVHEIFTPTEQEIENALDIIQALREAERMGSGVVALNGKMIDKPIVMRAERVLSLAVASGQLKKGVLS